MRYITEKEKRCGSIRYFCVYVDGSPVTCYVLRGRKGDMLIDTGISLIYKRLMEYISPYDIRYILLAHAHTDHDVSAARLRKKLDAEIMLGERDREMVGHFERQPVKVTSLRYRVLNL
ncbi:MBL fold metallo-hydrolase [Ruminococcus sp.]|uniref:MBL fold metallo-hydrolase n=1 Tax=Ruminococcus sp. TaxID=41978 RepID=UPI001B58E6E6|nr:MBL fold metallo-hydrolase [Ruminococcus sp.]MBP5434154.1 MBL fold metallo-hydrolase [Ruminococcus sp.]